MKTAILMGLLMGVSVVAANANDVRSPDGFCADKIANIVANVNANCFMPYAGSDQSDEAQLTLEDCAYDVAQQWQQGFGQSCGGQAAQDACYKQCTADGIGDPCMQACPQF